MRSNLTTRSPAVSFADAVATFAAAGEVVARLTADGAMAAVAPHDLPALVSTVARTADQATAVVHQGVAVVHRGTVTPGGHATTLGWLHTDARMGRDDARATLARSTSLTQRYTATGSAWLEGRISGPAVAVLTTGIDRAMSSLPHDEHVTQVLAAETVLIGIAEQHLVRDVARAVKLLRFTVDPDGAASAALRARDDQRLHFHPDGAFVRVQGHLTPETATLLETALDSIVDGWHRAGTLPEPDRTPGDDVLAVRRRRQRRPHLLALALEHIASTFLDNGELGEHHGVRPHLTVTLDLARVEAGLGGELVTPGSDEPHLMAPASIRRLLCDATLTAVITTGGCPTRSLPDRLRDHAHHVLHVGRAHRVVTVRQRRALDVRDQHCAFPGCRVSTRRTQAHHVTPWEAGGPTDLDNLVLLCTAHHHSVHEGRWTITPTDAHPGTHGYWRFHPPRERRP